MLFIERCLDMLNDGGMLAIVLPETVFHGSTKRYIRDYICRRATVVAVIELPHNTFRPHCNAKTCLLVLRSGTTQSEVLMAAPTEMGHDHKGETLYRLDAPDEIWDDLPRVIAELDEPDSANNEFVFVADWQLLSEAGHWMPRYFQARQQPLAAPEGRYWLSMQDLLDEGVIEVWPGHGSPASRYKGQGDVPYVRVADIVNWEIYRNPTSAIPEDIYRELTRGKHQLVEGDILFVKRGSYRIGSVAMASQRDAKVVLTSEILTIRVTEPNDYGITPFYLLALLSSSPVQGQIEPLVFVDTTLPNISNRWRELQIPVHRNTAEIAAMSSRVETAIIHKWDAHREIQTLRASLGRLVT